MQLRCVNLRYTFHQAGSSLNAIYLLKNESLSVLSCAVGILILNRLDTKITNLSIYLVLEQNQHMYFVKLSVGVFSSQFT